MIFKYYMLLVVLCWFMNSKITLNGVRQQRLPAFIMTWWLYVSRHCLKIVQDRLLTTISPI